MNTNTTSKSDGEYEDDEEAGGGLYHALDNSSSMYESLGGNPSPQHYDHDGGHRDEARRDRMTMNTWTGVLIST